MPNGLGPERLTLRQADQARTDFAIIEDDLEAIDARLAKIPKGARPCGWPWVASPRSWVHC